MINQSIDDAEIIQFNSNSHREFQEDKIQEEKDKAIFIDQNSNGKRNYLNIALGKSTTTAKVTKLPPSFLLSRAKVEAPPDNLQVKRSTDTMQPQAPRDQKINQNPQDDPYQFNNPQNTNNQNTNRQNTNGQNTNRYNNNNSQDLQSEDPGQIMFLDDIEDNQSQNKASPRRTPKSRLHSDEQEQSPVRSYNGNNSIRKSSKFDNTQELDEDENQILVFDQIKSQRSAKISVQQDSPQRDKNQLKSIVQSSADPITLYKNLINKFDSQDHESQAYDKDSVKIPEHLFSKTNSYDKSREGGEGSLQNDGGGGGSQQALSQAPHIMIGKSATQTPKELIGSNRINNMSGSLERTAILMSVQHTSKNPIVPYILVLIILDAMYSDLATWRFLTVYFILLITLPTYIWYVYFKRGLQNQFAFDAKQISVYNHSLQRFQTVPRSELKTGDLVFLQKNERFPCNILLISLIDKNQDENKVDTIQLSNGQQVRLLLNQLGEEDLETMEGILEYDIHQLPLLSDNSSIKLKLSLGQFKQFNDIIVQHNDLGAPDLFQFSGKLLGMVILTQTGDGHIYTASSLCERLVYLKKDVLDPIRVIYLLLFTSVLLSVILSVVGTLIDKSNQYKHKYISPAEIGYNTGFIYLFVNHLLVYQSMIPVFLEIIRPLFGLIAMMKYNRDMTQDGDRSGKTSEVRSPQVLEILGKLKFVNYNAKIFSKPALRVLKCYLLNREQPQQNEMWPYADEAPNEQEGLNKEQIAEVFEKSILGMPFGDLCPKFIALQQYCRLKDFTQYSYSHDRRTILLPKELLKYFPLILTCKQDDGSILYLYQIPQEEEEGEEEEGNEEEQEKKEKEREKEEDENQDISKLHGKIDDEKTKQIYRNQRHFIWILVTNKDSDWITQDASLQELLELSDENTVYIKSSEIDEAEFKELEKQWGRKVMKSRVLEELSESQLKELKINLQPISCFVFEDIPQHDFNLLLDFNAAEIRQWIYLESNEFDEEEPTLKYLQQYMQFVQWDPQADILDQINQLKGTMTTKSDQSLRNLKLQNNQYIVERKFVTLVLNAQIVDVAFENCKLQFLESLLMPSFILFLNLRQDQIKDIIEFQKLRADDQSILTFGQDKEDIQYCLAGTVKVCTSISQPSLYSDMCEVRLINVNALSKLVLTHSRLTNIRVNHFILFQIYKSLLITMIEFFFSFFNGYSSSLLFTPSFHFMYQALFTSVFSLVLFTFQNDVNHFEIRRNAFEFTKFQRDHYFNKTKVLLIFIDCMYQGFIIFYIPAQILQYANDQTGIIQGFYYVSIVSFITLLLTVSLQPYIYLSTITNEQVWLITLNSAFIICVLMTTCSTGTEYTNIPQYVNHMNVLLNSIKSIFIICFLTAITLTPTLIIHQYTTVCDPPLLNMIHSYKDELSEGEEEEINQEKRKEKETNDQSIVSHTDNPFKQTQFK